MKKIRLDGYASAVLGNRYKARVTSVSSPFLYAQGGLFARIVDKPSDDAVGSGLIVENDDGAIMAELERLDAFRVFSDAVRWTRLTGGACVIPIVQDGQGLGQPLPETFGQIEELRVYSADEVTPYGNFYNDPALPNYGRPMLYQINTGRQPFVVHESRVLTFTGEPLPQAHRSDLYWRGRDVIERPYQCIVQWIDALGKVMAVLERKQQAVYGMTGLAESIAAGFEDDVRKRIDLVDQVRGILNTVAIDAADSYDIRDLNLSGLPEAVNEFKEALAAETGFPITLLFGRSAAGMNATGEGDLRGYYDMVNGIRLRTAQPALERLILLIGRQRQVRIVDNWRIEWPPLLKPNAKELAEIAKIENDALVAEMAALKKAVHIGAISERQVAEYLQSKGLFVVAET